MDIALLLILILALAIVRVALLHQVYLTLREYIRRSAHHD